MTDQLEEYRRRREARGLGRVPRPRDGDRRELPEAVAPMLATPATGLPADDEDWGYELSWAGRRTLAYVSDGHVRLTDAEGHDVTSWYPELRPLGRALLPAAAVLDGEIVAFEGASVRPHQLQRRRQPRDSGAARRMSQRTPIHFLLYDVLWLDGQSTVELLRYSERRELLEGLELAGEHWQTPPYFPGGGEFALEAARTQGLGGVVAKRLDSPYLPGRRSRLWLTISAAAGS